MKRYSSGAAAALCCVMMLFGAAPQHVNVDVAALDRPAVAAKTMPRLAKLLLGAHAVPDPQTRLDLELVAGNYARAAALMRRASRRCRPPA